MSTHAVVHASDALLAQLGALVASLDEPVYTTGSRVVAGGSVGKHVRHILDHFGGAIETPSGEPIDYDHRDRGTEVEARPDAALARIDELRASLASLGQAALDERVTARVMCACDGACADLGSTRAREVFFAMHHAIHHNAILGAIATELGFDLPEGFGKAPSTINFENTGAASS